MKKKGFTLIELLAVIIILAVIALIATPIVLDVVESAKISAFESTAYGMVDAMKLKSAEDMIDGNSMAKEYTFPSNELDVQGEQLTGTGKVDSQGRLAIAIYNGDWCAVKGFTEGTITVKEYVEGECELTDDGYVAVTGTPIIDYVKALVYDEEGKCDLSKAYEYMGGCYIKTGTSMIGTSTSTSTSIDTSTATSVNDGRTTTLANHVWYNGFLWRIMGINNAGTENESIKMITEENVTEISFDDSSLNFDGSHVDSWLNDYFYNKLSNENNLRNNVIVQGSFCQEEQEDYTSLANTSCEGTILTKNVGLLTADEYKLSGEGESYLKNSLHFWTMSNCTNKVCDVNKEGYIGIRVIIEGNGVRPVINVKKDAIITSGTGTLSDFYVLGEYKNNTSTVEKLSNVKVGEYVSFNNKIYRVVENGNITKLILDGYYEEEIVYGDTNIFSTTSGIGYELNTDVLEWLTANENIELQTKYKNAILTSNWYQNHFERGNSYTVSLDETSTPITAKVGLIRVGEMLSGFSYSILTKNGTVASNWEDAYKYWSLTKFGDYQAYKINNYNGCVPHARIYSVTVRPVINLNSDSNISSGNGTIGSPYIVTY